MTLRTSEGCSLLLQRFAQFVEQPRVLDGDDRLRGEVLDELDLLFGKGPHFLTIDRRLSRPGRSSFSIGTSISSVRAPARSASLTTASLPSRYGFFGS